MCHEWYHRFHLAVLARLLLGSDPRHRDTVLYAERERARERERRVDDDADGDAAVPRTSLSPFRRSLERTSNAFEHWAVSSVSLSCQLLISTREEIKASPTT